MNKLMLFLIISIIISSVSATCTVNFNKDSYSLTETITAAISCSGNEERNLAYTLNWTYENGTQIELDTGTTPSNKDENFYQSYEIPSSHPLGIQINATLQGSLLEGEDFANVTATSTSSLVISNIVFGGGLIGEASSIKGIVKDDNGKKISGGLCKFSVWSNDEISMYYEDKEKVFDGEIKYDFVPRVEDFKESTQYAIKIICYCGGTGTATECIDEEGTTINNSIGSTKSSLSTNSWLSSNTVTDKTNYNIGDSLTICANVTNLISPDRESLFIEYEWRCSSGNDFDTNRVVLGKFGEPRGISTNNTQMQCHDFVIPHDPIIEFGATNCYASTDVDLLNKEKKVIMTYSSSSPTFNLSVKSIHPRFDWHRVSNNVFNAKVNYSDYAVGVKEVHAIINSIFEKQESPAFSVKNWTIRYPNGSLFNYESKLEIYDHYTRDYNGNIIIKQRTEIEIEDVNTSDTSVSWLNVTIEFTNFEERSTQALEGIESKTGTFHLSLDCPSFAELESTMECNLNAQIEESELVEKEVDFTCYIYDGLDNYSKINFNQMITKQPITIKQNFPIPSSFVLGNQYVVQCYGDYYNLGKRRDSFYDTFVISTPGSTTGENRQPITGNFILEDLNKTDDKPKNETDNEKEELPQSSGSKNLLIIFVFLIIGLLILILFNNKKNKINRRKMTGIIFAVILLLIIVAIIYLIFYLFNSNLVYIIFKDPLSRALGLVFFIVMMIILLSRGLNLRGEIRFGEEKDKHSKMQDKLNRMVLKREIHQEKEKIKNYFKSKKISAGDFSKLMDDYERLIK